MFLIHINMFAHNNQSQQHFGSDIEWILGQSQESNLIASQRAEKELLVILLVVVVAVVVVVVVVVAVMRKYISAYSIYTTRVGE